MNIVMIASEAVPFAKTGGLADIVGSLPGYLRKMGHDVIVILPFYQCIAQNNYPLTKYLAPFEVYMGDCKQTCAVYLHVFSDGTPFFFIDYKDFYFREGIYHDNFNNDYSDNPRRFGFLCNAALQFCIKVGFHADIVHAHDWQGAPALAYLKTWFSENPVIGNARGALTIHNIGYHGKYPAHHISYLGFPSETFHSDIFEDYGQINLLKGGIYFADIINTVSPKYAEEIKNGIMSYGMEKYLQKKSNRFCGILNGADYSCWNPEIDPLIPANYTPYEMHGKSICKNYLQKIFYLDENPEIPIFGIVSRFAPQKGLNLLADCIEGVINTMVCQFVILGSGDKNLENFFRYLPAKYQGKIGSYIGYNNELAHKIEAGSDFFVMPSIYEPCGLNQIYSLKYGTLPIVRATGGLDDTVEQYNETTGKGTGFKFYDPSPKALYNTIGWAVSTYFDRKEHFYKMRFNAMLKDFSFEKAAKAYETMYKNVLY